MAKKDTQALVSAKLDYAEACKLLRANKDIAGLTYYNAYATCKTLKVYFWFGNLSTADQLRVKKLIASLDALACESLDAPRGGRIFRFAISSEIIAKKNRARDKRFRENRKVMLVGGAL